MLPAVTALPLQPGSVRRSSRPHCRFTTLYLFRSPWLLCLCKRHDLPSFYPHAPGVAFIHFLRVFSWKQPYDSHTTTMYASVSDHSTVSARTDPSHTLRSCVRRPCTIFRSGFRSARGPANATHSRRMGPTRLLHTAAIRVRHPFPSVPSIIFTLTPKQWRALLSRDIPDRSI